MRGTHVCGSRMGIDRGSSASGKAAEGSSSQSGHPLPAEKVESFFRYIRLDSVSELLKRVRYGRVVDDKDDAGVAAEEFMSSRQ